MDEGKNKTPETKRINKRKKKTNRKKREKEEEKEITTDSNTQTKEEEATVTGVSGEGQRDKKRLPQKIRRICALITHETRPSHCVTPSV